MSLRWLLAACLVAFSPVVCSQTSTIFSENFDQLSLSYGLAEVGSFRALSGSNVDAVSDGNPNVCRGPQTGICVDLQGSNTVAVNGIYTSTLQTSSPIELAVGVDYYLSFGLIGYSGTTTTTVVSFGPYERAFVIAGDDVTSGIVSNYLISVDSPTSAYLTFTNYSTNGAVGALLDNVQLTASVAPVPEPSTYALMLTGIAAIGLWARRRRATAKGSASSAHCT